MFKKSKKYLSFILSLCMIVSMFVGVIPTAYAEGLTATLEAPIAGADQTSLTVSFNMALDGSTTSITDVSQLLDSATNGEDDIFVDLASPQADSVTWNLSTSSNPIATITIPATNFTAGEVVSLTFKDGIVKESNSLTTLSVRTTTATVRDLDQEAVDAEVLKYETTAIITKDVVVETDIDSQIIRLLGGQSADSTITITRSLVDTGTYIEVVDGIYKLKAQKADAGSATETATLTFEKNGKQATLNIDVTIQSQLSSEKAIISTTIGTLAGSSVVDVPTGTKVDALKSALTVSDYANVEILDGSDRNTVVDQVYTDVTSSMVIEVTAQDSSNAEYAIAMQAVLSNDTTLTTSDDSIVTGISGTTISVANAVYTQALVDVLVAPDGGSFKLQNADNNPVILDTLVVDTMKVVVTAEDNSTTATYTITVDQAPDTAPIVSSAETGSENTIVLTMDKSLTGKKGDPDAFTVIGIATNPTVTGVSISGTTVTITVGDVGDVIVASDTNIQISYNPSGTNDLTDGTSQVEAFDTVDVTNNIKYSVTFTILNSLSDVIKGATIEFNGQTLLTDQNGEVTFDNVENGTSLPYTVSKSTYLDETGTVDINNANLIHSVIKLVKNEVTFKVFYDDNETPIAIQNATVTLGALTPEKTDEFGSVTFTGVEDGAILYTVEANGYTTQNAQITVDGNNVTQTLTMVPESATTYKITFVVKDGESFVDGASVSLIDHGTSDTIVTYTTDINGKVIFNTIDAGEYNYSITKTGFAEKTGSISVVDTNLTETVSIDYIPVETSVVIITGSDTLESKLVGFVDYPAYTAVVNDQRDVEMVEKTVEWSIKDTDTDPKLPGVSINSLTGVVTVQDTATAGSFTIVATSTTNADVKAEKGITITKEVVVPVITITGANNATVKLEGNSTESYTYVVKDQYNRVVEEQTVSWSLKTPVTGVSVDDDGLVTIADITVDPSFTLVATLDSDEPVITKKTVTLTKEIQVVTSVEILDGETPLVDAIDVETDLNTLGLLDHKNYNVVVKDQYGTVMDGKTATITLKNPVAKLTVEPVEPNGTNIFRFGGGGFTGNSSAILVATSDDDASVSYELTVNITFKSKFTVVSEFLNGSGDVTVSLTPGGMIYANCDIENKTDDNTEVLMVFALYKNDIKGDNLQGISAVSKVVNARSLEKMKAGFLLPSDLTGYTARVFVWDGNDIATAENVLSNLIQIP